MIPNTRIVFHDYFSVCSNTIMLSFKFPPGFLYEKDGVKIEEDICEGIPVYEELVGFTSHFVSIREKYCPITNYDISGRASRGIFVGIPDNGIQAVSLLENKEICEVSTCTFSADRRSTTSRNCYIWGCEIDALERWYPHQSVMTPVFLDVSRSIPKLGVVVQSKTTISIRSIDLKDILEICFSKAIPFVTLRIQKEDVDIIKSYNLSLRAFEVDDSLSDINSYVSLVPPIHVLDMGALEYPGDPALPTILSQNQFKTIWSIGGDLKARTEQWIRKECKSFNKSDEVINTINEMVTSTNPLDQQDYSIYTRLYNLLFHDDDHENPSEKQESQAIEESVNTHEEDAPPPIVSVTSTEEENSALVVTAVPQEAESELEKQLKEQQGRAQSRVRDFNSMLPDYARCSNIVKDYLDIGCADGSITIAIGRALHLTKEHIFGCDVRDLPPESDMNSQFNFRHYDGITLPYCNNCFDLITIYMVLHHIANVESFLKEVRRVLRPGGLVIIREHDCTPNETRLFLDVQHGFYALVLSPVIETPDFCTTFQTFFRGKEEWVELMKNESMMPVTVESYQGDRRRGFNYLSGGMFNRKRADGSISNLLNSYYGVFRKVSVSTDRWSHDKFEQTPHRDQDHERMRDRERNRDRDRDRDRYRDRDRDRERNWERDRDRERMRDRDRMRDRERERERSRRR